MKKSYITLIIIAVALGAYIFRPKSPDEYFGITPYEPTKFTYNAESPFFYSIGEEVRFGRSVDATSPTLFDAKAYSTPLHNLFPSPDGQTAAIFSGDKLFLTDSNGETHLILGKITEENQYYMPEVQWAPDSQSFYIIRGKGKREANMIKNEETFSLIKVNSAGPYSVENFIEDFRSTTYFSITNESVCFNYAPGNGNLEWRCIFGNEMRHMSSFDKNEIVLRDGSIIQEKPFVTCSGILCGSALLSENGYYTTGGKLKNFLRKDTKKPILTIQTGTNSLKGISVDGVLWDQSVVLPGGRYVLLDIYHDKFKGQILVDSVENTYQELPNHTKIYYNLNSWNYETSQNDQIMGPMFIPRRLFP